ncbi:phosphoglycerate mutase-like protein [Lentinus brumalis]|uniref:Phosphoglycerate mutase-like protein n=1 Tax=Lentinus brumalis TaxID=2498619 RepID=A0A371DPJ3_9APHY|nr:phosphoglycerate mutase-like protein [Polyporus brumalis]
MNTAAALLSLACFALIQASGSRANAEFNPLHHSGPASPYFDAPAQFGIPPSTPVRCSVDQAAYIVRHGSRFPEPGSFTGWQSLFAKLQNATYTAKGPLAFLPSWVPPIDDGPHQPLFLSSTGSKEAFDLGVDLRKRYRLTKGGDNFTVWSAGQQRVVDTATYFTLGYLSQGNYLSAADENRGHVITMPDSVNYTFADSLTPSAGCPAYSTGDTSSKATTFRGTYQGKIADRLNQYLDGLRLNATDIGVMQDLCGFQAEVSGDTRFCDIFKESEWLDYEYTQDLNYYYGSGPGNPFSATTGYPWVKAVTELLVTGPKQTPSGSHFVPPPLIMSFTHDNNLPPVVSALGLWNTSLFPSVYPLSTAGPPNPHRAFRSSYLVSFRGYIALERLSAQINNAVVPVPGCASGPGSSCPLASFATYVHSRAAVAGDFVETCGLRDVRNATGALDIFTTFPSGAAQTSILLVPLPYAHRP